MEFKFNNRCLYILGFCKESILLALPTEPVTVLYLWWASLPPWVSNPPPVNKGFLQREISFTLTRVIIYSSFTFTQQLHTGWLPSPGAGQGARNKATKQRDIVTVIMGLKFQWWRKTNIGVIVIKVAVRQRLVHSYVLIHKNCLPKISN